jgi:hypothetical protein
MGVKMTARLIMTDSMDSASLGDCLARRLLAVGRIIEDPGQLAVRLRTEFNASWRHVLQARRALAVCLGSFGQTVRIPSPRETDDTAQICLMGIVKSSGI